VSDRDYGVTLEELEDPDFVAWVVAQSSGQPIEPDPEDYDSDEILLPEAEQANAYLLAQANKVIRLCRAWKDDTRSR
jgi:hypothetical protein